MDSNHQQSSHVHADTARLALSPVHSVTVSSSSSVSSEELENLSMGSDVTSSPVASPSFLPPEVQKHDLYYFEEGNVRLLVDNVLYNVPRVIVTLHSPWFRERLAQPAKALPPSWTLHLMTPHREELYVNHQLEVVQQERPVAELSKPFEDAFLLFGASAVEFDALLTVLLPKDPSCHNLKKEQWIAVLKLSTLWQFSTMRALAIKSLKPMFLSAPLQQLVVARTYDVDDWANSAIRELVARDTPLHKDEAAQLPLTDVIKIHQARELAKEALIQQLQSESKRIKTIVLGVIQCYFFYHLVRFLLF